MADANDPGDAASMAENGHTECPCHAIYDEVCQQAARRMERVRELDTGKLIEGTLEWVQKHPGAGVAIAALVGFYIGRIGRR